MEPLTETQQRVYDFLLKFYDEHGYAPSLREAGQGLGYASPRSIVDTLERLQRKGYITREFRKSRSIGFPLLEKKQYKVLDGKFIEIGFISGGKRIVKVG